MEKAIIKFILALGFIALALTGNMHAQSVYYVDTNYEADLLNTANIPTGKSLTEDGWYHSSAGIDKTAKKFVDKLPCDEDVILYGISLGGVVSRRMTQIAEENGKNVVGYIAQSSPLSGERLTNRGWALTSVGMIGGYVTICGGFSQMFFWLDLLTGRSEASGKSEADDFLRNFQDSGETTVSFLRKLTEKASRDATEMTNDEIIRDISIPLLQLLAGDTAGRGDEWKFIPDVLFDNPNNVKDLDPTGSFMCDIMNNSKEVEKELSRTVDGQKKDIRRAFIVSTNGDLYETPAWEVVGPVLEYFISQRDSYWAKACSQWWAFPFWALKSAAMNIPIATMEGFPQVWSFCVSGSNDLTSQDCFVPVRDTFQGKSLGMTAPGLRRNADKTITCSATSHFDYAQGTSFSAIRGIVGRKNKKIGEQSYTQQKEAIIGAYNHVTDKNETN